jgi:ATP-binding cassette subfamily F protein uup
LVLDEPTNDLDAETLELLEDMLPAFPGTVLLVSHDRAFLNNVVTSTIVFEGNGVLGEYDGGYDDWIRIKEQRENAVDANAPVAGSSVAKPAEQTSSSSTTSAVAKTRRLNFKEQRELDQLPELIASLEKRQKELEKEMATSGFYQSGGDKIAKVTSELASVGAKLEHCFLRWEELENGP